MLVTVIQTDTGFVATLQMRLLESAEVKRAVAADHELLATCAEVAARIVQSLRDGNKLIVFGNGGSAMDAGHLAAELVGRYYLERAPLAAVSLSDSNAALTAIGNDYSYDSVFARQMGAIGRAGDVAIGLTTSGSSRNIVAGLERARELDIVTVAITGRRGGRCADIAELALRLPSEDTPRVQEAYMTVGHTICELVERSLA